MTESQSSLPIDDSVLVSELEPHEATFTIGPITITAKYPPGVLQLFGPELESFLLRTFNTFPPGGLKALPGPVATLPDSARRWLLYALFLMGSNKSALPDFDYMGKGIWLAQNIAAAEPVTLSAAHSNFEYQVLGRTGWLDSLLHSMLTPLSGQDRQKLSGYYSYASGGANVQPAELDQNVLGELSGALDTTLSPELSKWFAMGNPPRTKQPMWQLQGFADWVQEGAWLLFQPYIAARTDGPFVNKYRYSTMLYDKTAIEPLDRHTRGYVSNRMNIVGSQRQVAPDGKELPSIFERAGYDASRPDHKQILLNAVDAYLALPKRLNRISFLVLHTESLAHGGGGAVGMVTEFPFHVTRAEWRWRQIRTLIHELGHVLMHPNLVQAADNVPAPQVIIEGFVEVITRELYNQIVGTLTQEIRDFIYVGVDAAADPDPTEVGYGSSGIAAKQVFDLVGRDRFYRAFFNGDISQVGLPLK